jgi:hypothetical protein
MNARENDREKGNEKEKREERREREIMEWVGERTHSPPSSLLSSHILEKSQAIHTHTHIYIHCAVANFLFHFNV